MQIERIVVVGPQSSHRNLDGVRYQGEFSSSLALPKAAGQLCALLTIVQGHGQGPIAHEMTALVVSAGPSFVMETNSGPVLALVWVHGESPTPLDLSNSFFWAQWVPFDFDAGHI